MTAEQMRDLARAVMLRAGGRGFMRFAPAGAGLLATDAIRRCACSGQQEALIEALGACGFDCTVRNGMLLLTPGDRMLAKISEETGTIVIDWESPLHPAASLAARWSALPPLPLTAAGRQMVIDTLRLTGTPGADVMEALDALRAQAAVMLRNRDRSGLHEAGVILSDWCKRRNAHED